MLTNEQKNGAGVTIPSQRRWVHYFGVYLQDYMFKDPPLEFNFPGERISLISITLNGNPSSKSKDQTIKPYFKIHDMKKNMLYNLKYSLGSGEELTKWTESLTMSCKRIVTQGVVIQRVAVQGEFHVQFYDRTSVGKNRKLFGFWLHTGFMLPPGDNSYMKRYHNTDLDGLEVPVLESSLGGDKYRIRIPKQNIDTAHKDPKHKLFSSDFSIDVVFEINQQIEKTKVSADPDAEKKNTWADLLLQIISGDW